MAEEIHHIDFQTLVLVNKEVVSLTGESHQYTNEDEERIRSMLKEVEEAANDKGRRIAIFEKASLLTFRVARGQHFHEGNKRIALVAGLAFLQMNGYTLDIKDEGLASVIDRAGVSTATLNEVRDTIKRLITNVR